MADRRKYKEEKDRDGFDVSKPKLDEPPNSRLFIVCNKSITEEEFRTAFEKYGTIEEIWVVRDRSTGEPKGVTYIKFSKTSEAALALEEMNGCCIVPHLRPLKVMIAHSRDQGSKREMNEEERLLRLFCVVPKTTTDQMLRDHFKQFGDIDYVSVVKDRETKESKGFAYVKFHKVSHAAKAFEGCDRSYKAVFAEPKRQKNTFDIYDRFSAPPSSVMPYDASFSSFSSKGSSFSNPESYTSVRVIASPNLNQDQLWRLFDLVPGLDFLHLDTKSRLGKGQAVAVYNSPQAALYAKEKLHGFEYPPGQRLIVKPDVNVHADLPIPYVSRGNPVGRDPYVGATSPRLPSSAGPPPTTARNSGLQTDLVTLAETIAQATSIIQAAGLTQGGTNSVAQTRETYDPTYCSVKLPEPQPLAPMDAETAERLFIVCHPLPPPMFAMRDVFGRFGNLIDVYMLSGKNCGYAKYASKEAAEQAIQTLHGQEVCGIRLKVMAADPRNDDRRKRLRIDDHDL
ncbi:RNA-binding protein 45 isoform X2 [Zootermopsis nevadensis]|uniref:RNA-binding protein 45 isoform X2 n=1 Tax=Zootermopsis nevadensis TaxID=136037 RepID=UPI000B8E7390|nr:RNA-binding protein 45 isoform X2 [Zootermopsis nevadensis]